MWAQFALDIQAPTGVALTGGSGWTLFDSPACSGDGGSIWYYYKIAGASEPSTYQFTYTGAATRCAYACAAYSGVDTTTPLAASLVTNPNLGTPPSSPVSMAANAVTTTADNQTVLYGGFVDWNSSTACAFTAPTEIGGFTERAKQNTASFCNCVLYEGTKTAAGSTGTVTATGTLSGASGNYIAALVALNDAFTGQTSYPNADGTDGAWTPSTGTDLYAAIDDDTDTEWIATDSNSTCRGGMAALDTPVAGTQTFAFQASGSPAKKLIATLIEGTSTARGTVTVDPLTATVTGYSFNPSGITDYADLDWQYEIADATTTPTPSVSFGAIGTGVNGSTSINVGAVSGITAGDYLTLHVTSGATNSETPSTPSGWTLLATGASTDGTFGLDTGPRRATVFGKVAGASEGSVTVTLTNGNTMRGTMARWTPANRGYAWDVVAEGANDSTSGTGVSMTTAAINWAVGDAACVVVGQRVDGATQSSQSLTASGTTFGTRTNRASTAVTTGNDHRHVVDTFAAVTTGGGSAATTWAYTASASVSAGGVVVRLREVPPTVLGQVYTTKLTIPEAAGSGGISGSASITQGANTLEASGQVAVSGSGSTTQGANTLAATGQLDIQGSAASTQGDTTVAATGGGATPITGSASITQGDNTCAATGVLAVQGYLSAAQAGNTVAATGTLPIQGAAATSQAANAVSATGQLAIQGSASINQAGNTVSATGALAIAGTSSTTQGENSGAATGQLPITGSSSVVQGANAVAAAGSGAAGNTGSANIVQASNTLAAAGTLPVQGAASVGQGGNTVSAIGTVAIIGTLTVQLDDSTVAATGQIMLTGSQAAPQAGHSLSAIGQVPIIGVLAVQLADTTGSASGQIEVDWATTASLASSLSHTAVITSTITRQAGLGMGVELITTTTGAFGRQADMAASIGKPANLGTEVHHV